MGGRPSRREQLLDEAARQLNARGVSQASFADIARQLGLTRSALYYYVRDVEDLVFQCYLRTCEVMLAHLDEAMADGDACAILCGFIDRALGEGSPEFASFSEFGLLRPEATRAVLDRYEELTSRLAAIIAKGTSVGQFRPCDPQIVARSLVSLMFWPAMAARWSVPLAPPPRDQLIAALKDIVLNGFAADPRPSGAIPVLDLAPLGEQAFDAFDRAAMADVKRDKILATASRLFNFYGVQSTTLDEIASALGVTKPTLYHFVGDKQALLAACFRRTYRIFTYIAREALALPCRGIEALEAYYRAGYLAQMSSDLAPLRPLAGYDTVDPVTREAIDIGTGELIGAYRAIISRGWADGSIRQLDLDKANLITPGISTWLVKGIIDDDPLHQAAIATEMAGLLRFGLQARPA